MADVSVNGRRYRTPERPTVVICFDGCDPEYIRRGIADGILPTIASFQKSGFYAIADSVVPSFTNPNNASIVTGVPPAVHGISGNYYLDRATGEERMITDASLMRCGTILAALADAGVATAAVTAKDKLRLMLARGLKGINFSSEHADRATEAGNGIGNVEAMVGRPKPDQYSGDLSLYVLDAGLRLLERKAATLLYLSLSDFIQHAHAPGTPEANAFNRAVDARIAAMVAAGAVVGRGRRSRHERQVAGRRRAQRRVSAGGAQRALRRRRRARHLPDHRPVRAPSRGARLVRAGLRAQGDRPRGADGGEPGAAGRGGGARRAGRGAPLRAAARSGRRFRRAGRCRHGRRRHPRRARSLGPRRPSPALARGARRAEGAVHGLAQAARGLGVGQGGARPCATSTSSMPCSTASTHLAGRVAACRATASPSSASAWR